MASMSKPKQILVNTTEAYAKAKSYLGTTGGVTMDLETNGKDFNRNKLCGVGILGGDRAFYFSFRHGEGQNLPEPLIRDLFETVLPPERPQLGHNYTFDIKMGRQDGMAEPEAAQCSLIRTHLLEQDESLKLENICARHIDPNAADSEKELEQLVRDRFGGTKKTWKGNMWRLPADQVYKYGTQDLISCRDLRDFLTPHLVHWKLDEYALEVEEYQKAITDIEYRGVLIDTDLLAKSADHAKSEADKWEAHICDLAGEPLNPRSPKQVCAWLGIHSSAKEILQIMSDDVRAKAILEHRAWSRVTSNYYKRLLDEVTPAGRHHPDIQVTGTVSGRPSCWGLNWFGIPRGDMEDATAAMSGVKQLVIPPPGMVLVEFDLSQAEIRALAHYMQQFDPDCMLFELIATGQHYHTLTAKKTGLPLKVAKALNLSAQYGIGVKTFGEKYGFTRSESTIYLATYHRTMPGVKLFSNAAQRRAEEDGYVRIADGRVRKFKRHDESKYDKHHTAANNLCQGMIAARIRRAIVRAWKEVPEFEQVLNVYDSMIGYLPADNWREPAREVKAIMEEIVWSPIQYKADVKVSDRSWYHAKEITL